MTGNSKKDQEQTLDSLKQRNKVLEEELKAQEDMLSRTTNYLEVLQEKLRASNEQLETYNHTLEEKVVARTNELEEKNIHLVKENKEKEAYQHQLEKANKELNDFMYRTSHDLRGPLTNTLGLLELMENNPQESPEYLPYVKNVVNQMFQMVDFIHYVIYSKSLKETPTYIAPAKILESAFDKAKTETDLDNAKLYLETSQVTSLYTLPKAFEMVFQELFKNSIKFTPTVRTAQITVKAELESKTVHFLVADNGTGIENEIEGHIYDMFVKGNNNKGKGLGLYLVKAMVEKIEGAISLINNTKNGTTFSIALPQS
ncbi:MAG: hypothetical protein BRD49_03150 [Bacteroidetes bacterium SW_10_40_5]|nr:MAG: hypothetical protein BRD49_03150 [Bacteroidetes bacterium SW_10_40_5]